MKIIAFLLAMCVFLPGGVSASEIREIGLEEAITIALGEDYNLRKCLNRAEKADLRIKKARASLLPKLYLSGSCRQTEGEDFDRSLGIGLRQMLYDGGRTSENLKYYEEYLELQSEITRNKKRNIVYDVRKNYYSLLLKQKETEVNAKWLNALQEISKVAADLCKSGKVKDVDISRIKTQISSVTDTLKRAENSFLLGQRHFAHILNVSLDIGFKLTDTMKVEATEIAPEEAAATALGERLRQINHRFTMSKHSLGAANAGRRFSAYLNASYSNDTGGDDSHSYGLSFSLPLFDGWYAQSRIEEASADMRYYFLSREKSKRDVIYQVGNALRKLKDAEELVKEKDVRLAEDSFRKTFDGYKSCENTLSDTLSALSTMINSCKNYNKSSYNVAVSSVNLEKCMGVVK